MIFLRLYETITITNTSEICLITSVNTSGTNGDKPAVTHVPQQIQDRRWSTILAILVLLHLVHSTPHSDLFDILQQDKPAPHSTL